LNYALFKGNKKLGNQLKGTKTKRLTGYDKLVGILHLLSDKFAL
jgi:hypothetical protein